jgi:hypothetical protein
MELKRSIMTTGDYYQTQIPARQNRGKGDKLYRGKAFPNTHEGPSPTVKKAPFFCPGVGCCCSAGSSSVTASCLGLVESYVFGLLLSQPRDTKDWT